MNTQYSHPPRATGLNQIMLCALSAMVAAGITALVLGGNSEPRVDIGFKPTRQSLEQLAELVALRVRLADTLTVDARQGRDRVRAAWIIRGDALVGVDVGSAVIASVDPESKTARVVLPEPRAISPRIDHLGTSVFDIRTGILTRDIYVAGIQDRAMRMAQRRIAEQASDPEHLELARQRIEFIVREFYAMAGWTIEIQWGELRP